MNLLLDTHALLWAALKPGRLSPRARRALLDSDNAVAVSVVSFWEIALKSALGKLDLKGVTPGEMPGAAAKMGFEVLPLAADDAATFDGLPREAHRDPFDRMLVWQAIRQGYTLVTRDAGLEAYGRFGLRILW